MIWCVRAGPALPPWFLPHIVPTCSSPGLPTPTCLPCTNSRNVRPFYEPLQLPDGAKNHPTGFAVLLFYHVRKSERTQRALTSSRSSTAGAQGAGREVGTCSPSGSHVLLNHFLCHMKARVSGHNTTSSWANQTAHCHQKGILLFLPQLLPLETILSKEIPCKDKEDIKFGFFDSWDEVTTLK